jgi:hypothetical protein
LADPPAEAPPLPPSLIRFPTAAVAVLEFTGDWPALTPAHARLEDFTAPADL